MSFLLDNYNSKIKPELVKFFNLSNPNMTPKVIKVSLNMGLGPDGSDKKLLSGALEELTLISGQKAVISKAKKSISGFKLREGQNIGAYVTLRGKNMYYFLERLIYIAMPRIKDFRGLRSSSFDSNFNFSFGIKDHLVFPELSYDTIQKPRGLNVAIHIKANTKNEAIQLLKSLRIPIN